MESKARPAFSSWSPHLHFHLFKRACRFLLVCFNQDLTHINNFKFPAMALIRLYFSWAYICTEPVSRAVIIQIPSQNAAIAGDCRRLATVTASVSADISHDKARAWVRHCTFLLDDFLIWTAPSVRPYWVAHQGPTCHSGNVWFSLISSAYRVPVTVHWQQPPPRRHIVTVTAMVTAKYCARLRLRERGSMPKVQTILHGLVSRDGTRMRSKGMTSTFCSTHSNRATTYRTLRYGIGHRMDTSKVLTDIV